MSRADFQKEPIAINSITIANLMQACKEEAAHVPISNAHVNLLRKHLFTSTGRVRGSD